MAEETGISWADMTFNPWIGCAKVSPACDGCYADALMGASGRHKRAEWGGPGVGAGTRSRTAPSNWAQPRRWDKKAAAEGTRPFVFCASLADVFDNEVPHEWRRDLFDLIRATPNLTWLLLTKRPGMIERLFGETLRIDPRVSTDTPLAKAWPRNAAIGCTVVNQEEADRDIIKLIRAKNALNPAFAFLSMEPLLGPVDLQYPVGVWPQGEPRCCDGRDCGCMGQPVDPPLWYGIDWIITGGETSQGGHKARPQHPDWFRSLRDQAVAARIAFHHKQNGEFAPGEVLGPVTGPQTGLYLHGDGRWTETRFTREALEGLHIEDEPDVWKVGKERAGRMLDGRTWDERPFLEVVGS